MAGDWIKVEKSTARKPEVLRIADILGIHPSHAFGLCVQFWSWCDDQMADGHAVSVTIVTLDSVFGHAGFVSALINVGWLRVREGSLEVPNFDRHLSESAKKRALSGNRKQKQRQKPVTEVSRAQRDESVTREEKRRINTPLPPQGDRVSWVRPGVKTLRDPRRLLVWMADQGVKAGLVDSRECQIRVLACAIRANRLGDDPPAFFAKLILDGIKGDWGKVESDLDEATQQWREADSAEVSIGGAA